MYQVAEAGILGCTHLERICCGFLPVQLLGGGGVSGFGRGQLRACLLQLPTRGLELPCSGRPLVLRSLPTR